MKLDWGVHWDPAWQPRTPRPSGTGTPFLTEGTQASGGVSELVTRQGSTAKPACPATVFQQRAVRNLWGQIYLQAMKTVLGKLRGFCPQSSPLHCCECSDPVSETTCAEITHTGSPVGRKPKGISLSSSDAEGSLELRTHPLQAKRRQAYGLMLLQGVPLRPVPSCRNTKFTLKSSWKT